MKLTVQQIHEFQELLWDYYGQHGRDLPWRQTTDPYKILVSEIMLQQTQVTRVIPKYHAFLEKFPDISTLARATTADVLAMWSGLGYNRRAKYLHAAAQVILDDWRGKIPNDLQALIQLPGIGHNTAAAVLAYAFNQPGCFIETNIRTVYIYHFFNDQHDVTDKEIMTLVQQTVDQEHPREFYWALMDYGSHLKATVGNQTRRSRHYQKQSVFNGSLRQLRGEIVRQLINGPKSTKVLSSIVTDKRLETALQSLQKDGLVVLKTGKWQLP